MVLSQQDWDSVQEAACFTWSHFRQWWDRCVQSCCCHRRTSPGSQAHLWTDTEKQVVSAKGRRRGTEEAGYPGSSQTKGTSFTKAQSHETFREQRIIWTLINVQTVGPTFWWVSYMWKFSQKMNFKTKVFKHRSEWLHVYKMHVGILWVQFQTTATQRYCGFNSRPRP